MRERREWSLAELDEMAERKAEAMTILPWGDAGEATHRRGEYERQAGGVLEVRLYSIESDATYRVARGWCTCPHYLMRCQRVPAATCGHQRALFPPEPPPEPKRTAAEYRAEISSIFG